MKKILLTLMIIISLPCLLLANEYKRIISLAPSITQSLYDLGIEDNVIGITVFCPQKGKKKEIVGTLLEPDMEKIIFLKPDLIIATKEGNNKAATEKIIRLGYKVHTMELSKNFEEICLNFYDLANELGYEKKAIKIIEESKEYLKDNLEKIKKDESKTVFWEVGARPLYTAGSESYLSDYNYYTNTINVYNDLKMRYPPINIEDVLERNPEIIILVNMGDISAEEIDLWKKYKNINAVKNNKIFMLDANDIFTPTPLTFVKGVKIISKILYPEFFK